jgi:negative regulator of replication initiation
MRKRCTNPAQTPRKHRRAAQTLRKYCANTAQTLRKHCANIAQTCLKFTAVNVCKHTQTCANAAQTLRKHCANAAKTFVNIAQTLRKHCANLRKHDYACLRKILRKYFKTILKPSSVIMRKHA